MTAPILLGMEWTSWRHFARSIFFHSSRMTSFRDWMLDGEWFTFVRPYSFEANSSKNIYLGLITPEYTPESLSLSAWALANSRRAFLCLGFRRGFFYGRHPCMPFLCSVRRILSREIVTPVWLYTSLDNCSELACRFSSTLLIRRRSWRGVNFRGRPGRLCEMVAVPSFLNVCTTFATVFWLISKALLIFL